MTRRSVLNYEDLQYVTQLLLIYALQCIASGLLIYLLVHCAKRGRHTKRAEKLAAQEKGKGSTDSQPQGSGKPAANVASDGAKENKSEEKVEKKPDEKEKGAENKDEQKKQEAEKEDKKEKEKEEEAKEKEEEKIEKEEQKILQELKPRQIKHNEKEERIAQGKEVRNKGDYPTFNDVESDWDSDKDKKEKKSDKKPVEEKKSDKKPVEEKKSDKKPVEEKKSDKKPSDKADEKNVFSAKTMKTQSCSVKVSTPICKTLNVEPIQAKVAAAGGKWMQKLTNPGDKKLMFKIRCSNNNEYRVHPVFGFVDPSGNTGVEVVRLNGSPKEDKLVVQYAVAPPDATDAQVAFAQVQPMGNITINVTAS